MSNPNGRHGGSVLPPGSAVVLTTGRVVPTRNGFGGHSAPVEIQGGLPAELDSDVREKNAMFREEEAATQKNRQNRPSPRSGSSTDVISRTPNSQESMPAYNMPRSEAIINTQEASESSVELQPQGNLPSYSLPVGQRQRMHQIGYRNAFNSRSVLRWKHSRFHQPASQIYSSSERIRHRDAVGRVFHGIEEDRFIHPVDFHLARMLVQSVDEVYSGPSNATWRRTFIRNQAPWAIRIANWPFNSVKANKEHWDNDDWTMIILKWPVSCFGLCFTILKPGPLYDAKSKNNMYASFNYKYWGYSKVARNALENVPDRRAPHIMSEMTHAVAKRPLHPRRLCFLNAKNKEDPQVTLYDVDLWMKDHSLVENEMQYVFIAYTANQFSHDKEEDINALHAIAREAARDAGVAAYWVGASCMSENRDELENDVYRISDVIRAAHSVVIAIKPSSAQTSSTEQMLKDWGKRMWTLPEALLSPKEQPLRIYSSNHGSAKFVKEVYKKNLATLIWDDSSLTRQLVDHYEGNLILSRLELVILALRCLSHRASSRYLDGDMAYVLMGLLRQRPIVDRTDSEFQAFARLSLANDSDSLLERLICLLPQSPTQPWYRTEDAYNVNLWDIQPTCQIAGVGENDTVILDGCYGASIQWEKFVAPWHAQRTSWKRSLARAVLRIGALIFFIGIIVALVGVKIGWALVGISLPVFFASPYVVRVCYGGKVWNVTPHFLGFEGYLDLETIESNIYGAPVGRLAWNTAGSPLSRHKKNEFGECVGEDPTADLKGADLVTQARYSSFGQEKVFTLVDTREGLVTLFSAVRPPIAVLMCGQEGGMQRAVMVSLDWKTQTLFRETVLRMPTVVLERMYRVNRLRIGLKRPLDPTIPRTAVF